MTADDVIRQLRLEPHPEEGGFYRETYRDPCSTAIYYLLTADTCSALHRLPGPEIFHFYLGDPVVQVWLEAAPHGRRFVLGTDLAAGEHPQLVVPGGVWQGAHLRAGGRFALLGTTMAPGFAFADYEPGDPTALTAAYPDFAADIARLTPRPRSRR